MIALQGFVSVHTQGMALAHRPSARPFKLYFLLLTYQFVAIMPIAPQHFKPAPISPWLCLGKPWLSRWHYTSCIQSGPAMWEVAHSFQPRASSKTGVPEVHAAPWPLSQDMTRVHCVSGFHLKSGWTGDICLTLAVLKKVLRESSTKLQLSQNQQVAVNMEQIAAFAL